MWLHPQLWDHVVQVLYNYAYISINRHWSLQAYLSCSFELYISVHTSCCVSLWDYCILKLALLSLIQCVYIMFQYLSCVLCNNLPLCKHVSTLPCMGAVATSLWKAKDSWFFSMYTSLITILGHAQLFGDELHSCTYSAGECQLASCGLKYTRRRAPASRYINGW